MDTFTAQLNELLFNAFQSVLKIEEQILHSMGKLQLSISEIHLLEAVSKGGDQGQQISALARELSLSPPSVTVAVKKLEKKGMLQKVKGAADGRTVSITLTELGAKVDRVHHRFHENMVRNIAVDLTGPEREVLLHAMEKLNEYFNRRLIKTPAEEGPAL